jgi:hypothetical protein
MCRPTLATFSGVLNENLTVIQVGKEFNALVEPRFSRLDKCKTLLDSAWYQFNPLQNSYPVFLKGDFNIDLSLCKYSLHSRYSSRNFVNVTYCLHACYMARQFSFLIALNNSVI